MIKNIFWVEANLRDRAVMKLVSKLSRKKKGIEIDNGGCGCGDSAKGQIDAAAKQA